MRTLAVSIIVIISGLLGFLWYISRPVAGDFAQCQASKAAGGNIGGPFELVNTKGKTVTDADVLTKPSLVYFGYTFCPDVCPLDVSRNVEAVDILSEQNIDVTPVFISIDPARDTPEVMSDYAENMHEKMIALTGSDAQVAAASKAYKTYYKRHDDGTDDYLVDHSTFTYLVMPSHGFVEFFRRDISPEDMASRVACFVENS